jgi:tRNA threonylcarbamoyl adenosine modification protein YeaZ
VLLAIDSSGGTSAAVVDADGSVVAEAASGDSRAHAESIGVLIADVLRRAGDPRLDGVAYGTGPGPFTGLRVGMAAARAFAWARELPTLPVVSHDAVAAVADVTQEWPAVVVADAKRREVYFTLYRGLDAQGLPERVGDPQVGAPATVPDLPRLTAPVTAAGIGRVAAARIRADRPADASDALYLRSPDVTIARRP